MNEIERKPDSDEIREFVIGLADDLRRIDDRRKSWPSYLFHVTTLENALRILAAGKLSSRTELVQNDLPLFDSANPEVIFETRDEIKSCARLYFRPCTPTQYRMEGFRPRGGSKNEPHGISVVFLFDSLEILTRLHTRFTDRNPSRSSFREGSDSKFLSTIPFVDVYHDSALPPARRDEIIGSRCAEVLVPGGLVLLPALKGIRLRSPAESDTLHMTLRTQDTGSYQTFRRLIRTNIPSPKHASLFFRKWSFVERISFRDSQMSILFSTDTEVRESMPTMVTILGLDGQKWVSTGTQSIVPKGALPLELPARCRDEPFIVDIQLDGRIAYRNDFPPLNFTLLQEGQDHV